MYSNVTRELPPPISLSSSFRRSYVPYLSVSKGTAISASSSRDESDERVNQERPVVLSLLAYCINALYPRIHQISDLETCWTRRPFQDMKTVVHELLPQMPLSVLDGNTEPQFTKGPSLGALRATIHPQLWALINAMSIPSTLPPLLRRLALPLSDPMLPSIQMSPFLCTDTFCLLTSLSLESPEHRLKITDDTIVQIRTLKCLSILCLAGTPISSKGIARLLAPMRSKESSTICLDRIRILDLRRTFVDDTVITTNKNGVDLTILPFLCTLGRFNSLGCADYLTQMTIDLRGTKVSLEGAQSFRALWPAKSDLPLKLFHPTPAQIIMNNLSHAIQQERTSIDANALQCDYAFLFIDRLDYPELSATTEERREFAIRDQKVRVNTSSVAVVTPNDVILGNVHEGPASAGDGVMAPQFRVNHGAPSLFTSKPKNRASSIFPDLTVMRTGTSDAITAEERSFMFYRNPPVNGADTATHQCKLPHGFTLMSDLTGEKLTKRKRAANDAYPIKRFKGSAMRQIFGATGSLASRHL